MLGLLRKKKTAKRILWILAATIIPVFAFWGVGSVVRSNQIYFSGTMHGRKISDRDFLRSYAAVRTQAVLQYGAQFNKIAKFLNLKNQAWQRLILLDEANKQSIKVSNEEVVAFIQQIPLFSSQGRFNEQIYNRVLVSGLQMQPRDFEEQVRDTLKVTKLQAQNTSKIEIAEEELKQEYIKQNTEYKILYVKISAQDFLEKNEEPEEGQKIDAKALQEARDSASQKAQKLIENLQELEKLERFDFRSSLSKLDYEVKESEYFKTNSFDKDLGPTAKFAENCSSLNPGALSPVTEVQNSFFIFTLKEKQEPGEEVYSEEKQDFRKNLTNQRKYLAFQEFLNKLIQESRLKENPQFFEKYKIQ